MPAPSPSLQPGAGVDRLYTTAELAALWSISERHIKRLITLGRQTAGREGLYPVRRLGARCVRIPASVAARFVARS